MAGLFEDAVAEMSDAGVWGHAGDFQFNRFDAEALKQADATFQQDWHQVNADFVEQTRLETLAGDIRAAHADHFIAGDGFCGRHRAFNTIGDEGDGEPGLSTHSCGGWWVT